MKTWAWILGIGGAFTAFAGVMAARAKAQARSVGVDPNAAPLAPGVVATPGAALTPADVVFINQQIANGATVTDANNLIALYAQYKTNFASFVQSMQVVYPSGVAHGTQIASMPRDLSFQAFTSIFH